MTFNLNRKTGPLMMYFMGGSTACFPAYFIFCANYDEISGNVFLILGAVFLIIGALLLLSNKNASANDKETTPANYVYALFGLNVVTMIVMYILGSTVKFY